MTESASRTVPTSAIARLSGGNTKRDVESDDLAGQPADQPRASA